MLAISKGECVNEDLAAGSVVVKVKRTIEAAAIVVACGHLAKAFTLFGCSFPVNLKWELSMKLLP